MTAITGEIEADEAADDSERAGAQVDVNGDRSYKDVQTISPQLYRTSSISFVRATIFPSRS